MTKEPSAEPHRLHLEGKRKNEKTKQRAETLDRPGRYAERPSTSWRCALDPLAKAVDWMAQAVNRPQLNPGSGIPQVA